MADIVPSISQADIKKAIRASSSGSTHQYSFGDFFLQRLTRDGRPMVVVGYLMAESLVVADLKRGIDGFTNEPTPSDITGLPPMTYGLMAQLVRTYLPNEFQDAIATIEEEMLQERLEG